MTKRELVDISTLDLSLTDLPKNRKKGTGQIITGRSELLAMIKERGIDIPKHVLNSLLQQTGITDTEKTYTGGVFMSASGAENFVIAVNARTQEIWDDSKVYAR